MEPIEVAKNFISTNHPHCDGALLAGSVVRGDATETSDLDIVIFDRKLKESYRESLIYKEWKVELFVHNLGSYKDFFKSDCERARPSLPRMVSEGIILKGKSVVDPIKMEAKKLLAKGPRLWSKEDIETKRYFISDALDDFIGSEQRDEEIFIAQSLAEILSEFVLRTNKQWVGTSKWTVRALKQYDPKFAKRFVLSFDTFYRTGKKEKIISLVDEVLTPYGGRLFEGYSVNKP
ncbi:nucleotidyltransferase domain-containing protein [Filobacillus milosensis]|uniref:Nucleotidyltransferase domain-containing protein n=1 Tax=Filobacillus milosensis TaxID=94137 RepID=A0A4Y8IN20_9BACI|nr:nucleotidyltransferase domain-containing protein [Filobacillus milosensis]TFB19640.1 nucleotidyltransferase domain-containing protein [Filobacillus milosensis]